MSSETWGERCDRLRGKPLSAREIEIMDLVIMGMDRVKVIADHLGVSDRTVEMHIQAVRVKLRVSSLLQAALAYDRAKGGTMHSGEHPIADGMREHFRRGGRR